MCTPGTHRWARAHRHAHTRLHGVPALPGTGRLVAACGSVRVPLPQPQTYSLARAWNESQPPSANQNKSAAEDGSVVKRPGWDSNQLLGDPPRHTPPSRALRSSTCETGLMTITVTQGCRGPSATSFSKMHSEGFGATPCQEENSSGVPPRHTAF